MDGWPGSSDSEARYEDERLGNKQRVWLCKGRPWRRKQSDMMLEVARRAVAAERDQSGRREMQRIHFNGGVTPLDPEWNASTEAIAVTEYVCSGE